MDDNRLFALRIQQRRIGASGEGLEARNHRDDREDHTHDEHGFATHAVRQPAEENVERDGDERCAHKQHVGPDARQLHEAFEEDLRVGKHAPPDGALRHQEGKDREQHEAKVLPLQEDFGVGCFRDRALLLHLQEFGALVQAKAHPYRDADKDGGRKEWNAPAPGEELLLAHRGARADHDCERAHQAEGGR